MDADLKSVHLLPGPAMPAGVGKRSSAGHVRCPPGASFQEWAMREEVAWTVVCEGVRCCPGDHREESCFLNGCLPDSSHWDEVPLGVVGAWIALKMGPLRRLAAVFVEFWEQ